MADLSRWAPSLTAFAEWLTDQDKAVAQVWSRRLNSGQLEQVESAVAEAVIWDFIGCCCKSSRLAETPGHGGADFEFTACGRRFLVEVTNISVEAASGGSGMPAAPPHAG